MPTSGIKAVAQSPSPQGRVGTRVKPKCTLGLKRGRRPLKVGSGPNEALERRRRIARSPSPQGRVGTRLTEKLMR
ncbi:hypothetical protein [Candidatus Fervidibacter sacchari]|uniref:hypothetical protein n=1 Tax=Candidatus Fervidibacter sacchari TaxID=1448929 RepID=UPI00398D0169